MKRKILFVVLIILYCNFLIAQNTCGYWDRERSTYKEKTLYAGAKFWLISDELPTGTTEIVYRITVLEEGQKITNTLAETLLSVPDPFGISRGSAMAIKLLSQISGDDKCYYSIFNNSQDANNFYTTGNYKTACYSNPEKINREVNRITITNSICMSEDSRYLWFGFKNANAIHSEKIVLEIMPWIDNKEAKGWTNTVKTQVLENCKTNDIVKTYDNPEQYCLCLINKLENNYSLSEFQKLLPAEMNKIENEVGLDCLEDTGEIQSLYFKAREEAILNISRKEYAKAINKYLKIAAQTTPEITDYNNLGYCYLMTKQYTKAIKQLKEGEKLDDAELLIKGNLAHALLLSGEVDQAKTIYLKYKSQNIDDTMSWGEMVQQDFEEFEKAGIQSKDFKGIINLIK